LRDRIVVRGIRAVGHHGLAELGEREKAQSFVVDVEVRILHPRTDDIASTVDYRDVTRVAREVIERESFSLVETIAETIADRVLALGAESVFVRVMKPDVAKLMDVGEVGVIVERP
jgi:7,8-dihydroneopterin aldolase/epimerase/oxygenase